MREFRSSGSLEGLVSNHDSYSDFVEIPTHLARVTLERSQRGARLPRPKLCIYGGSGEIFSLYFADKISSGNRNPQGDAIEKQKSELPPGAGSAPESRDQTERDAKRRRLRTKVTHPVPAQAARQTVS